MAPEVVKGGSKGHNMVRKTICCTPLRIGCFENIELGPMGRQEKDILPLGLGSDKASMVVEYILSKNIMWEC